MLDYGIAQHVKPVFGAVYLFLEFCFQVANANVSFLPILALGYFFTTFCFGLDLPKLLSFASILFQVTST